MGAAPSRFWGWPGVKNLAYAYLVLGPVLLSCYVFVYGGCDYLTGLHHYRVPLYFEMGAAHPVRAGNGAVLQFAAPGLFADAVHPADSAGNERDGAGVDRPDVRCRHRVPRRAIQGRLPAADGRGAWPLASAVPIRRRHQPAIQLLSVAAHRLVGGLPRCVRGQGRARRQAAVVVLGRGHHAFDRAAAPAPSHRCRRRSGAALAGSRWLYPALRARFTRHLP